MPKKEKERGIIEVKEICFRQYAGSGVISGILMFHFENPALDGDKVERILAPGEVLKVDTGNVVVFEPSVSYEIETVKEFKIFFGGEGLFLIRLMPGK